MAINYLINGENGDENMSENIVEKDKRERREKQVFNYGVATLIQFVLGFEVVFSFISATVAMFNGDNHKWFLRNTVGLGCLAAIGIIAAIKSLFVHESGDSKTE